MEWWGDGVLGSIRRIGLMGLIGRVNREWVDGRMGPMRWYRARGVAAQIEGPDEGGLGSFGGDLVSGAVVQGADLEGGIQTEGGGESWGWSGARGG